MKRLLLWVIGVVLGVAVLLSAVMGVSYAFTTEGARPQASMQFAGVQLEPNGSSWKIPLLGGVLDRVFMSPATLTVQKLGTLYESHPALDVPDWCTDAFLTITNSSGDTVFDGTAEEYAAFLYPANGEYKAKLTVWRLPDGMTPTQYKDGQNGSVVKNNRLERPARPTGWYSCTFRFALQASAAAELSAERVEQGGVVCLRITGMTGDTAPSVETDLGSVQCTRCTDGWCAYLPAAYNSYSGGHEVKVTVNGETILKTVVVTPKDFGTAEVEPEPAATEQANDEFRNKVWPLYEQEAREKQWSGGFVCPAENYMILVDYGQVKSVNGKQGSRSNSVQMETIAGDACRAPANGVVVLAQKLELTGNTVVIDHGCGVRSYLYGLQDISVMVGQTVEKAQSVGTLAETLTMDTKIGNKSIDPWLLFKTSGGMFWRENEM